MIFKHKTLRYYYWLLLEFSKKHAKMILLSFFISLLIILSLVSFSPYLDVLFFARRQVVGMVGRYDLNTLPDEILGKISYGLVYVDPKGSVRPAIASTWEILDGGKQFRFHLKDGLVWDDGKDFSAKDIRYNFRDVETKAIDNRTIHFTLKKALPIFPTYLAKPIVRYPLHGVVGDHKVDKVRLKQGSIVELSLSPTKKGEIPKTYKFYDNESQMINAYKLGNISEMIILKKSVADTFKDWKNTTVSKFVDYSTVLTLFFNLKNPQFQDKDVRQAFSLAVPRNALSDNGEQAESPIPPTSWAYNTALKKSIFDVDLARKNLKQDEKTATSSAKLTLITYYDYIGVASILEESFKQAGANVDVGLINEPNPKDYDMLLAFWKVPNDPDQYFYWHSTQTAEGNITNYKNVRIDKLLEDGRSTLDVNDRKKYYLDFQKVFADDLPAIMLYHPDAYTIKRR